MLVYSYSKHVQSTPEDISTSAEDIREKARLANLVRNKWMSEKRAKKKQHNGQVVNIRTDI